MEKNKNNIEEVSFFLETYGDKVKEYLGTNKLTFFFFPGVETYVDKFENVSVPAFENEDTSVNFYFRGEFDRRFYSLSFCEIGGKKLVKFVSPFLRKECYDYVIVADSETEAIYEALEEKQKAQNSEDVSVPVIGRDFNKFKNEIIGFLTDEKLREFCRSRNIPLKRGYCFSGHPGVGKSMFLRSLKAECLKRDIDYIQFQSPKEFMDRKSEYYNAESKKVFVLEDFDSFLQERSNGDENKIDQNQILQSLLQVLDGIDAVENVVTILTTNHADKLDSALMRSGRIDKSVRFELPTDENIKEFFKAYLPDGIDNGNNDTLYDIVKGVSATVDVSFAFLKGIADDINIQIFNGISINKEIMEKVVKERAFSANKGKKTKKKENYSI